ncbi:2-keto-3-deoxygluconate permease [Brevibacillus marinus]|uniref:2-keto-3-deoxygluconate permease n=1 Tax=Brevibacillus marinus TaxID=2496837 RepID=UPI0013E09EFF|nr:2-keto-3-deoxygluconate permease [Brevibacillus marinus]
MKNILRKVKSVLNNKRGTVLLEKKVLLAVIVVGILGLSSLAYPWLRDYFTQQTDSISNNTQINESIQW